jgi:hypothetical protein
LLPTHLTHIFSVSVFSAGWRAFELASWSGAAI